MSVVYLRSDKSHLENLTLISQGQMRTEELATAEQAFMKEEFPAKIQACQLAGVGVIGIGLLVGALFRARIGVLVSSLCIFPWIGAFYQSRRRAIFEEQIRIKLEPIETIFRGVCSYLDGLTRKKANTLIKQFNEMDLITSSRPYDKLEELEKAYKNDELSRAQQLAASIYKRNKPSVIPLERWAELEISCCQCIHGTSSVPYNVQRNYVSIRQIDGDIRWQAS